MKKTVLTLLTLCIGMLLWSACTEKPTPEPIANGNAEKPRYIAAADGNIYVTCYQPRSVVRIDTATQKITGICHLGSFNPEGICAMGSKLYIASSNISDENYNYMYDNKIYVVDIATFTLTDSIIVNMNPSKVLPIDNNHLVVSTIGDYPALGGSVYGKTQIINTTNKEVTDLDVNLYNFDVYNGYIYGYTDLYSELAFYRIDGTTHQSTRILTDWDVSKMPYGISINPYNGDIVVNTNGNYRYAGDCHVYRNDLSPRMNAVELGFLPSKALALDADHLLVLNEGNWGNNEAELSLVDVNAATATNNYFAANNGRGLGDVGQDIIRYGSRIYIAVTYSNSIEVLNPTTGKSTRIALAGN